MAIFSFQLESFKITQTRSEHLDTDAVACSLAINPKPGVDNTQSFTRYMGDLNNGLFTLGLSFPQVTLNPDDFVVFNYLIVNSGNRVSSAVVEQTIQSVSKKLAVANTDLVPAEVGVSALQSLAKFLELELAPITRSKCDGAVAVEQSYLRYADLVSRTANGPFDQSVHHAGNPSPSGCGKNSIYIVNWQALERGDAANVTVPNVTENPLMTAENILRSSGLTWSLPVEILPNPEVVGQDPASGVIVSPGTRVNLTLETAR